MIKSWKNAGWYCLIFALQPKFEMGPEILILHSDPKVMCLVVHYDDYYLWFWKHIGIVSEKAYASILLVFEITSLNISLCFLMKLSRSTYLTRKFFKTNFWRMKLFRPFKHIFLTFLGIVNANNGHKFVVTDEIKKKLRLKGDSNCIKSSKQL